MIFNRYEKSTRDGIHYYFPNFKNCIFTDQLRRELGRLRFEVPEEIKSMKAMPLFSPDTKLYLQLSRESQVIAVTLFQLYATSLDEGFPEVICVEIEGGKYLKFQFLYFYFYDFLNVLNVMYEPMEVVSKEEASKYLIRIDLE